MAIFGAATRYRATSPTKGALATWTFTLGLAICQATTIGSATAAFDESMTKGPPR